MTLRHVFATSALHRAFCCRCRISGARSWPPALPNPSARHREQVSGDVTATHEDQRARTLAGDATTVTPAARSAAILSLAVPLPPEMIAPACPIRRPGGAVRPAMKDTIGLVVFEAWKRDELVRNRNEARRPTTTGQTLMNSAASSSAVPPISPIMMIPSVCGSTMKRSRQSTKLVPLKGSPPMPTHVDWPRPTEVVWKTCARIQMQ